MKAIYFEGANTNYAEHQPEYQPLPAHRSPEGDVTTCWGLTLKERLRLLFTGRVFFIVLTFNKPLQPILAALDNPIPSWDRRRKAKP